MRPADVDSRLHAVHAGAHLKTVDEFHETIGGHRLRREIKAMFISSIPEANVHALDRCAKRRKVGLKLFYRGLLPIEYHANELPAPWCCETPRQRPRACKNQQRDDRGRGGGEIHSAANRKTDDSNDPNACRRRQTVNDISPENNGAGSEKTDTADDLRRDTGWVEDGGRWMNSPHKSKARNENCQRGTGTYQRMVAQAGRLIEALALEPD